MWPFTRRRERRALFNVGNLSPPYTAAGVAVGPDTALRLAAVWRCVDLLASTIASLPLDVFKVGERTPLELPPVLVHPSADLERHEWLEAVMRSLLLHGNGFALVVDRGSDLRPSQLEPLDPSAVSVQQTGGRVEYRVGGKLAPREDVWHLRAFVQPGAVEGLSPIACAREGIGLGLAAQTYGARLFGSGTLMGGYLQTDADLGEGQAESLKARWHEKLAGLQHAHEIAVLDNGAKFVPLSMAPKDSQFIEARKFTVTEIATVYGIPVELINGDSGGSHTYLNAQERSQDFLRYTLTPWLRRLEVGLGALLPRTQYCRFNVNALLRPTTRERYEAHRIAIESGFMTVNEVRALEDLEPLEAAA